MAGRRNHLIFARPLLTRADTSALLHAQASSAGQVHSVACDNHAQRSLHRVDLGPQSRRLSWCSPPAQVCELAAKAPSSRSQSSLKYISEHIAADFRFWDDLCCCVGGLLHRPHPRRVIPRPTTSTLKLSDSRQAQYSMCLHRRDGRLPFFPAATAKSCS